MVSAAHRLRGATECDETGVSALTSGPAWVGSRAAPLSFRKTSDISLKASAEVTGAALLLMAVLVLGIFVGMFTSIRNEAQVHTETVVQREATKEGYNCSSIGSYTGVAGVPASCNITGHRIGTEWTGYWLRPAQIDPDEKKNATLDCGPNAVGNIFDRYMVDDGNIFNFSDDAGFLLMEWQVSRW